jgi:excisionase family DNA binding protein
VTRMLTIDEVADRLRISKRSAYRVVKEMIRHEIGGRLVVPEQSVERYLERHTLEPTWAT